MLSLRDPLPISVRGHRRPQKLGERPVAHVAQAPGYERRKPPALALRREVVGRRAHAGAQRQQVLQQPGIGTGRVDADGEILHEPRSEEHTSELQSLMRISYAVFRLKKKK